MSTNFTSLGIAVNSSEAVNAAGDLDKLVDSAEGAEKAIVDLGKAGDGLANTGKKITQAESEVAQGVDKSTAAIDRRSGASRKATDSAVSEINVIAQLDRAMTGNITSMESLMQAEGLLERAKKGGLVTVEEQVKYQEQLGKAFDKIEKAEAKETAQKQRLIDAENRQIEALKRTVNGIDPVTAKLAKLEAQEKAAHEAFRVGAIDVEAYNSALAKVGKDRAGVTGVGGAISGLGLNTKAARENVLQLGNALAEGNVRVAAHNFLELAASAGSSAIRIAAMAAPIGIAVAALGTLAYGFVKGKAEAEEYNKALILTGNYAGTSAGQLSEMSRQVAATVGTTGQAAGVLAALAGSGKVASASFTEIAEAALSMEKATGKSVEATVAEFVKIAEDPVAAAKSLNEQYHFLTASVYSQIVALKEQGDIIGAAKLLTDRYADAVNARGKQIVQDLGYVETAWRAVTNITSRAIDDVANFGRQKTIQSQIDQLDNQLSSMQEIELMAKKQIGLSDEQLDRYKKSAGYDAEKIKAWTVQRGFLQGQLDTEKAIATAQRNAQVREDEAIASRDRLHTSYLSGLDKEAKKKLEIEQLDRDRAKALSGKGADASKINQEYEVSRKALDDKYKPAKEPANQVDLTSFNNAKNNLSDIVTDYRNAQKELEAEQKRSVVSLSDYAMQRSALINQEKDDVTAAYQAEIDALEAAKAKKGTTAAQSIQLDQKIADARQGMVKAQKDADSQLKVLATNEDERLAKQKRSISSYVQALGQQQRALELAGQRAVLGVGQGDRQNALNGELNSQQDRFSQQALELENQRSDPSRNMSEEEFKRKSQALADANKAATDQIRQNYADVENAQGDWTKGATAAWDNYLDSARNVAGQTKSLFGNAFSSMEDAVVNFATTGKFSFADFTKSVLADMARIATRQASSALLSSLVGSAASYGGSAAGGNGLAAGSAGAASSNLGASAGGYSGSYFPQALGGAWSGGVQMFADGGAFTNSVVSKPTVFGMANGKTGVMGEAGAEAIMPLTRTANGKLGVMAMGGGGAGATQINVEVHIDGDGNASSSADAPGYDLFGKELAAFVEQKYQQMRNKDMGQGGVINKAIKGR